MADAMAELKRRAEAAGKTAAKNVAEWLVEQLFTKAIECIDEFYGEYNPDYYNRWGQLYNTPHKIVVQPSGNGYVCGLMIDDLYMADVYNISAETVFDIAVGHGIHGVPGYGGVAYESAISKMDKYYEDLKAQIPERMKSEFQNNF